MKTLITFMCLFMIIDKTFLCEKNDSYSAKVLMDYSWRLSEASNQFGFNIFWNLANRKTKNIVFSPISVSTTIGLVYFGARGTTEKELERVLGYKSVNLTRSTASIAFQNLLTNYLITVEPRAYVLDLANALFVNKRLHLRTSYQKDAGVFYKSLVEAVSFSDDDKESVRRINDWVQNKTRGKFSSIVDYLDPSVDLIAANVLYFKSRWMSSFADMNTRNRHFYDCGKISTYLPMMEQEGTFLYFEDEELSVVHLGFLGRNISMIILLPHQTDGLLKIEENFTFDKFNKYLDNSYPRLLKLQLPKFNLSFSSDLVPSLRQVGAGSIFQRGLANLTGIVFEEHLTVDEVRHKAVIEVNEAGVEASGVTATISFKSLPLPDEFTHKFVVDHPFLFFILDERTDTVLLMGRVWSFNTNCL